MHQTSLFQRTACNSVAVHEFNLVAYNSHLKMKHNGWQRQKLPESITKERGIVLWNKLYSCKEVHLSRCREGTCAHSRGERSETDGESSISIHTPSCVKWAAGKKLAYNTGSPAQCSVMTKKGEMGWREEGSRGNREMYNHNWFALLYGRHQCNIVKI